jgi:hypothetical protein
MMRLTLQYYIAKTNIAAICVLILLLGACVPTSPPVEAPRSTIVTQRLLNEPFSFIGNWSSYQYDDLFMDIVDSSFQAESGRAGRFAWSSNDEDYEDTILEVDITWLSDYKQAMVGVICRGQATGNGYYVLISYDGNFSIRRGGQYTDNALRKWRRQRDIPRDGSPTRMRVVCVDNYLGLYINGEYIDGAVDSRFNAGLIGLVVGLPSNTGDDDIVAVQFDNLRVWNAELK